MNELLLGRKIDILSGNEMFLGRGNCIDLILLTRRLRRCKASESTLELNYVCIFLGLHLCFVEYYIMILQSIRSRVVTIEEQFPIQNELFV